MGPQKERLLRTDSHDPQRFYVCVTSLIVIGLILSLRAAAQTVQTPEAQLGKVMGTVTDVNGDAVIGATVALKDLTSNDPRSVATSENGFFKFDHVKPGGPYEVIVSANGFDDWTSPAITLGPGEFRLLEKI